MLTDQQRAKVAHDCEKAAENLRYYGWTTGDLRNSSGELCAVGALFAARLDLNLEDMRRGAINEDAYTEINHCITGQAVAQYIVDLDPDKKRHEFAETIFSFNDHLDDADPLLDILRDVAAKYRPDAYRSAPAGG